MIRGGAAGTTFIDIEQRSPPGKTILDSVPMADSRFTQLPAKKHYFGPQHAREVNETLLHSLAQATVAMDFSHPLSYFGHQPSDFAVLLESVHEVRRFWIELLLASDCFAFAFQSPNIFEDAFNQRTHSRQQRIGFIDRKKSRKRIRGDHRKSYLKTDFLCRRWRKGTLLPITAKDPFQSEALAAERYCLNDRSYER